MNEAIYDRIKGKKIIIFGAGYWGQEISLIPGLRIDFFVDNDRLKETKYIGNYPIYYSSKLLSINKKEYFVIVANEKYYIEISENLKDYGFLENVEFTDFRNIFQEFNVKLYQDKNNDITITGLRYNVTYRCNSRCKICNCWENTQGEMSPAEYADKISSEFYSSVEDLYITGGEPFVLDNFSEYINESIKYLPSLKSISTTTNALRTKEAINQIIESNKICKNNGVELYTSVSIDGLEKINDEQRGVKGSFKKAMEFINALKSHNISVTISSTISKINIWEIDKLNDFFKALEYKAVFKMGIRETFFNNFEKTVFDFDEDEIYQIKLFFYKILQQYDRDEWMYAVCINTIKYLEDGIRLMGCHYKDKKSIALMENGEMKYCSSVAKKIALKSNEKIQDGYINNYDYFEYLQNIKCNSCLSDTFSYPGEKIESYNKNIEYWNNFYTINFYNRYNAVDIYIEHLKEQYINLKEKAILITGWYGTETVGDKAILGQIINECKIKYPNHIIKITSIYPFITKRTLYELEEDAEVVTLHDKSAIIAAMNADIVIMGGGPLMEMDLVAVPLWLFKIAKSCGKRTMIRGCGIGPLYSDKIKVAVKELLLLADEISLRDKPSCQWALENAGVKAALVDDPAVLYLIGKYSDRKHVGNKKILACFLREITAEYSNCIEPAEFEKRRKAFENGLAENIKNFCKAKGLIPYFYSMHNFAVGNDDRDFNFRFVREYFDGIDYFVENKLATIDTTINAMLNAEKCLCMRFHSNVFAQTLKANYIGIDYTDGGKVMAFTKANGKKAITIDEIISNTKTIINL